MVDAPRTYPRPQKFRAKRVTEPTHETETGALRPGASDLRSTITPELIETNDLAWRIRAAEDRYSLRRSAIDPQLAEPYAPLSKLIHDALEEYGDFSPGTVFPEVSLMFVRLANKVVEDLRRHPYWEQPEIDYYVSLEDTRPIPDMIMLHGLIYYYCVQQKSEGLQIYGPLYFRIMNGTLYSRKYGNGPIQMQRVLK